ncbi:hypothetical protein CWE09_09675 [Aliidiomarina minuta]|uniref:Beta-lactamase-related domain-containing protein n=1 Tax=Aliidiomarina minuta TaxID=880057 RepID=A0A432WA04_9GAMM|nr:serine hydrolase domain-containing protein [Aliidiomarina minuta]RUO26939.1 hypothetical protein CWE09_09675 [Aliidiomarina minuta]
MNVFFQRVLLLAILWLSFSPPTQAQVDMMAWPSSTEELEQRLQQRVRTLGVPAASIIIFDTAGVRWRGDYGSAAEKENEPLYAVGNLTEMMTSIAIMQLVEQQTFSLQSDVGGRLPELQLRNPYAEQHSLQLVHLLEHSSGLDQRRFRNHYRLHPDAPHIAALNRDPGALQVRWPPGTMSSPSSVNYAIIGALLESHYEQSWQQILHQQVLSPLRLESTFSHLPAVPEEQLMPGHLGLPPRQTESKDRWLWASEGAYSSAADMARLGQFWLTKGRDFPTSLLSAETLSSMEQPRSTLASDAGLIYGVGAGVDTRARFAYWHGKTSSVGGHSATLRYAPQHDIGYVILTNTDTLLPALEEQIWQFLIRDKGGVMTVPSGIAVEQRWQGWYQLQNPQHELMAPLQQVFDMAYMSRDGADLDLRPWLSPTVPLRSLDGSRLAHRRDGSVVGVLYSGLQGELQIEAHGEVRQRVSTAQALMPAFLVLLSVVILLTHPFGRHKALNNSWMRTFITLSALSLLLLVFVAGSLSLEEAATDNWRSVLVFVFSLTFPLFALAGLFTTLWSWRHEQAVIAKIRCLIAAVAACGLSLWFWYAGWLGLRLWAW